MARATVKRKKLGGISRKTIDKTYLSGFEVGMPGSIDNLTFLWHNNMMADVEDFLIEKLEGSDDSTSLFFAEDDIVFMLSMVEAKTST